MIARESARPLPAASPQPADMPGTIPFVRRARPGLITDWHLGLLAIIYIRQSTPQQILVSARPNHTPPREGQAWTHARALGLRHRHKRIPVEATRHRAA